MGSEVTSVQEGQIMGKIKLTDKKYGHLTVLGEVGKDKSGHYMYKCKCDCGKVTVTRASNLALGHTTSCGCAMLTYQNRRFGRFV